MTTPKYFNIFPLVNTLYIANNNIAILFHSQLHYAVSWNNIKFAYNVIEIGHIFIRRIVVK